ncbi:MAG: hypothetical protein ACREMG_03865, partial [Gemmatimonadales bacterium]
MATRGDPAAQRLPPLAARGGTDDGPDTGSDRPQERRDPDLPAAYLVERILLGRGGHAEGQAGHSPDSGTVERALARVGPASLAQLQPGDGGQGESPHPPVGQGQSQRIGIAGLDGA